jgi:hypothetical protein
MLYAYAEALYRDAATSGNSGTAFLPGLLFRQGRREELAVLAAASEEVAAMQALWERMRESDERLRRGDVVDLHADTEEGLTAALEQRGLGAVLQVLNHRIGTGDERFFWLAEELVDRGYRDEVFSLLDEEEAQGQPNAHALLDWLKARGDEDKLRRAWRGGVPRDPRWWTALAELLLTQGRYREAFDLLREVEAQSDLPDWWLADCLIEHGHGDEVLALVRGYVTQGRWAAAEWLIHVTEQLRGPQEADRLRRYGLDAATGAVAGPPDRTDPTST